VAVELGERLAHAGFGVMTGGYAGAMEAVSEGAKATPVIR
jgi:predicted Rossmann-fold nucleotide-binding protein